MKPLVSTRMRKAELAHVFRELRMRGYTFPPGFDHIRPEAIHKLDLIYAIEEANPPSTVFGHVTVLVAKQPSALRWAIAAPGARSPFLFMSWIHAFRWRELATLTTAPDQFAALTVCLRTQPLTTEDLQRLNNAFPGVMQLPMFEVDEDEARWEVESTQEEPEPLLEREGPAEEEAGPPSTTRQPSLGRKITY